jgi:hypothetical protein
MFLPEDDRDYLSNKGLVFEETLNGPTNGLIIRNYRLPANKFSVEVADLLIMIPSGYPDIHPDMWYFSPPVLLKPNNTFPPQTEAFINFGGTQWQRWSRHLSAADWRSSVDGIHTYLKKVDAALEKV